ncbi:hypothetical protein [Salibacterium sp. K-3]
MKKTLFLFLFILLSISVYYDLTEGILDDTGDGGTAPSEVLDDARSVEVTVESGQTVLSIIEKLHEGPVPVTIDKITSDFQRLNDGTDPGNIQVDKPYRFPIYTRER